MRQIIFASFTGLCWCLSRLCYFNKQRKTAALNFLTNYTTHYTIQLFIFRLWCAMHTVNKHFVDSKIITRSTIESKPKKKQKKQQQHSKTIRLHSFEHEFLPHGYIYSNCNAGWNETKIVAVILHLKCVISHEFYVWIWRWEKKTDHIHMIRDVAFLPLPYQLLGFSFVLENCSENSVAAF